MSFASEGLAWHAEQLLAAAGQQVTYRRGATEILVTAVRGQTEYEATTADETRIRGQRTDWIFKKTEIDSVFPPQPGDQIETDSALFEVQNLGEEPCYREFRSGRLLRIHVRFLSTV